MDRQVLCRTKEKRNPLFVSVMIVKRKKNKKQIVMFSMNRLNKKRKGFKKNILDLFFVNVRNGYFKKRRHDKTILIRMLKTGFDF